MSLLELAWVLNEFCEGRDVTLTRLPLGYPGAYCRFENPIAYLGKDAGGAVGSGPVPARRSGRRLPSRIPDDCRSR